MNSKPRSSCSVLCFSDQSVTGANSPAIVWSPPVKRGGKQGDLKIRQELDELAFHLCWCGKSTRPCGQSGSIATAGMTGVPRPFRARRIGSGRGPSGRTGGNRRTDQVADGGAKLRQFEKLIK